jgi:hypothetical protein
MSNPARFILNAEIEKSEKKKTSKSFWKFKKDFYLCSPNGNEGKNKAIKTAQCHRNIADTEVEATKFFKKTQSCKRDE